MNAPRDAMADREVVARFMGWKHGEFWTAPHGVKWRGEPPVFDSESAPRSLMSSVEQEIVRRGWWARYCRALTKQMPDDWSDENHGIFRWFCLAPASARCAAAADTIREMEGSRNG